MLTLNREELAWAAGFFDGEGCIRLTSAKTYKGGRKGYPHLIISISQAGPHPKQLLERFRDAVGGIGKIYGPYVKSGNSNCVYQLETKSFPRVQAVIAMLWTFLGPVKREQSKLALSQWLKYHHGRH